jgi:hypothetical protein
VVNVLTFNLALDALGGAVPSQDPTTLSRP